VSLRIVTDNDKAEDPGSDIQRLQSAGIPIRVDHSSDHMHHKFAVFDAACLITGSYNWTRSASEVNEENVVLLYDRSLVRQFRERFEALWVKFS
jgi:phosphatidylserine/phosphatidylglycerophosphate/cardiolipin synthase-like enzyme